MPLKEKLLLSFKKHHFYYRILLPFSIFSIILICIMSGINWYWIEDEYNQKIIESNQQLLKRASELSDQYLYEAYTTIINSSFLSAPKPTNMDRFITYGHQLKHSEFLDLYQSMSNICTQNTAISHISLYQYKSNLYLSTSEGLIYQASTHAPQTAKRLIKSGLNSQNNILYLTPTAPNHGLIVLRSIPLYSNFKTGNGFVSITLNTNNLWKQLQIPASSSFFILDNNGEMLINHANSAFSYDFLMDLSDDMALPSFFSYDGVRYRLDSVVSETSGWQYISFAPINTLNAGGRTRQQFILMMTFICILFSLAIVQRISVKAYQPIANLKNRLTKNYTSIEVKDDLSLIEETFSFLENQVDDVQKMIRKNSSIFLYKIFMDILTKKELSDIELMDKLELYGIPIVRSHFCLILIEFDTRVFYNLSLEQREYLISKSDILLKDFLNIPVLQSTEAHPDNRIAVLLNLDVEEYIPLSEQLELLPDYLYNQFHLHINLSFSTLIERLSDVSLIYERISKSMKYFFLLGYGNIFSNSLIKQLDDAPFTFSTDNYQKIECIIREGNADDFSNLMDQYQDIISSGNVSYQEANNFLIRTYRIAFNIGKELGLFDDTSKKEQILYDFQHAIDVSHSIECICLIVQMCHELVHEDVLNKDSMFIQQILDYINSHQKNDLSLSHVANMFNVSTGHLSRLFKSVTHQNFSTYVTNIKLEAAAAYLCQDPEQNITAIAADLGYYTPSYFTKLFKEKFGVTPSQYRRNIKKH